MLHASRRGCLLGVLHVACCVHESVLMCMMLGCMEHVCCCVRWATEIGLVDKRVQVGVPGQGGGG